MTRKPKGELRRGWTTGACATAATQAALHAFWGEETPEVSRVTMPRGEVHDFEVLGVLNGDGWAEARVIKDAGDDPDVTHGAQIVSRVSHSQGGVVFKAGEGVGTVTKAGLPIPVGDPAINPVPRQMMCEVVEALARIYKRSPDITIEISVPNGADLAQKTWNPRLGIKGGLSILGTTGIVRPFSCAAWIASIHRGVDVARADGLKHVAGCTGATSEACVQQELALPDHAMLDMGDFAGGLLKYLNKHPIERLTIGGGIGKLTKLAQGAVDLHSSRSQVDFEALAEMLGEDHPFHEVVCASNTALEALTHAPELADLVAQGAQEKAAMLASEVDVDVIVVSRTGEILGRSS